jgi:hypothetical protein
MQNFAIYSVMLCVGGSTVFFFFLLQLQWSIAVCFCATLAQLGSFHVSSFWWLRWSKRCLGRTTDRIGRANALLSLSVRHAALLPSSLSLFLSLLLG